MYAVYTEWHIDGFEEADGYTVEDAREDASEAKRQALEAAESLRDEWQGHPADSWWRVDVLECEDDDNLDYMLGENGPDGVPSILHIDELNV